MQALSLLVMLLAQDPDVEALLKQLGDDSIEVREKAAAGLVDLGVKAEERIKKELDAAGGELKPRLEGILRSIAGRRKLAEVLPPLRLVTIDAKERKLRDVLEDFQRQSGMAMNLDGLADAAVTLSVKDAAPFEALDAICKVANLGFNIDSMRFPRGRLVVAPAPPGGPAPPPAASNEPMIRFMPGGYAEMPRVFVRHYQVEPSNISLSQSSSFRGITRSAVLQLQLIWHPGAKPGLLSMEIASVTDDKGRSLYDPSRNPGFRLERPARGPGYPGFSPWNLPLQLIYPEADAKQIAVVKGTATLKYVMEEKLISFGAPDKEVPRKQEYDGVEIELQEFKPEGENLQVKLSVVGQRKSAAQDSVPSAGQFDHQRVRLRLEDGSVPPMGGMSGRGDGKTYSLSLTFRNVKAKVVAVEVVMDTTYHDDKFEFELKNIELPR